MTRRTAITETTPAKATMGGPSRAFAFPLRSTPCPYSNERRMRCQRFSVSLLDPSTMSPPWGWQHAAGCVGGGRKHRADRILAGWRFSGGWSFGQTFQFVELSRLDGLQRQVAVGKPLNAAGRVEPRPFGAKDRNGVAFAA